MGKNLVGLVILAVLATGVSSTLETVSTRDQVAAENQETAAVSVKQERPQESAKTRNHNPLDGRFTKIKADARGHYVVEARLNGRRTKVLVDTGATSVAINRSLARRIGIKLKPSDFRHVVSTANGQTKAAFAMIDSVEIGRVRARNVRAAILEDRALSTVLLGMTFLGKLKKFEISNRTLVLAQ